MNRKVIVTGANGFVARYLVSALKASGAEVVGVDIAPEPLWNVD
ncbi:MAG: NAD-dependent epimerase/dehydratase family protein, partial [Bacteroidaceae bacterium]|nr:NAD-dependent epimerase/dehydratase family protein [Bacteroidaceae bacterium]